jgi:hypothetical protein
MTPVTSATESPAVPVQAAVTPTASTGSVAVEVKRGRFTVNDGNQATPVTGAAGISKEGSLVNLAALASKESSGSDTLAKSDPLATVKPGKF